MAGKHGCTGFTRSGEPCSSPALKDSDPALCLAHAPAEVRQSVGFIPDNGKGGRPRNPRAVDVLRERIEADIDRVIGPLFDALEADRSWYDSDGEEHSTVDHSIRLQAVRELLDRVYGKPKQATELTGPEGGPIQVGPADVSRLTDEELTQLRGLLDRAAADA